MELRFLGMCELDLAVGVFSLRASQLEFLALARKIFAVTPFCELSIFLHVRYGAHALSGAQKSGGKGFSVLRGRKDCDLSRWF